MQRSAFFNRNKWLALALLLTLASPFASFASGQIFLVSDQFVKDVKTRLIWSRDANPGHFPMSWDDAVAYIKLLNARQYAGRSDWRLPELDEIKKLMDNARAFGSTADSPEQNTLASVLSKVGFRNVEAGGYWTSSNSVFNEAESWYFSITYGDKFVGNKSLYMYVWPVRWEQHERLRRKTRP